jgi:nicotinamide mononucleotide transporter
MNPLEITAVILALVYLLLALRQNRLCWIAAFISALIYWVIFAEIKLYMEAGLQVVYAAMAIVGWVSWGKDNSADTLAGDDPPRALSRGGYRRNLYRISISRRSTVEHDRCGSPVC